MKKRNFSLFLMVCASALASVSASAGGIGRIDGKGEPRPDPQQSMERAMKLNSGVRKTHETMLHNIRLQSVGLETAKIARLRDMAQRQTPEVVASLGRLLKEVVGTPSQTSNLSNMKAVAVEVLKARIEIPWISELRSNVIDEAGHGEVAFDNEKVDALPEVGIPMILLRIDLIRKAAGLPVDGDLQFARTMKVDMSVDQLEALARRTETDLHDRVYLWRVSDPVAAQFIEDIIAICPYFAE